MRENLMKKGHNPLIILLAIIAVLYYCVLFFVRLFSRKKIEEDEWNNSQDSTALNNAPPLSASDFDKQLLNFVKDFSTPYEGMSQELTDLRIGASLAANVKKANKSKDLPLWPLDTCYVCLNAVSALYQLIPIDSSQLKGKIKRLDQTIKTYILSGIFAWDKVRNIVHVNNKQLDRSLLDCPCSSLAKLPQWAICFNVVDKNLLWFNRPVAGVIFYRNFKFNENATNTQSIHINGLDGEPDAEVNYLSTIIISHTGRIDLGPYIELNESCTVNSYLDNMVKRLQSSSKTIKSKNKSKAEVKKQAIESAMHAHEIFVLLAYFLENLDKLKNEKGKKVRLARNPKLIETNQGYRLFGNNSIRSYYLD